MKKQTIVMLVGVDMCGKTQIGQELSTRLGIPYFKPSDEKHTFVSNQSKFLFDLKYADTRMVDFLQQTGHSVIFDRGYPCEWVYSQVYNRETNIDALKYIDNVHSQMGTKIIVTYRSSYLNITDDLDQTLKGDKLKKIEDLYRDFSKWTRCKIHFLNVDSEDLDKEISEIFDFLRKD